MPMGSILSEGGGWLCCLGPCGASFAAIQEGPSNRHCQENEHHQIMAACHCPLLFIATAVAVSSAAVPPALMALLL